MAESSNGHVGAVHVIDLSLEVRNIPEELGRAWSLSIFLLLKIGQRKATFGNDSV